MSSHRLRDRRPVPECRSPAHGGRRRPPGARAADAGAVNPPPRRCRHCAGPHRLLHFPTGAADVILAGGVRIAAAAPVRLADADLGVAAAGAANLPARAWRTNGRRRGAGGLERAQAPANLIAFIAVAIAIDVDLQEHRRVVRRAYRLPRASHRRLQPPAEPRTRPGRGRHSLRRSD